MQINLDDAARRWQAKARKFAEKELIPCEIEAEMKRDAKLCLGEAGSVCLMHTRLAHGSEPNLSAAPRTLFISVYSAGDAMPCSPNPVPTEHMGLFVRGGDPHRVRGEAFEVSVPEYPKTSFFAQQLARERGS